MNNVCLLTSEYIKSIRNILVLTVIIELILLTLYTLTMITNSEQTNSLRSVIVIIPFIPTFIVAQSICKSYIFNYTLSLNLTRQTIFGAAFWCVLSPFIILIPVLICVDIITCYSYAASDLFSITCSDTLFISLDMLLFASVVFSTSIWGNDMLTFASPLLPFFFVFTPDPLRDLIKVGYVTPFLSDNVHCFCTTWKEAGGIIYLIGTSMTIYAIVAINQGIFCNKDI